MIPAVIALSVTVALMPLVIWLAHRIDSLARPRADRWGARPVPRIGGIAIVAGLALGVLALPITAEARLVLGAGVGIMGLLGLADDVASVSPASRLAIEAAAGALAVGLLLADQGPIAWLGAGIAAVAIPIGVNATNMVDNADGLAAGLSAITGLALAVMSAMLDSRSLAITALLVPAAALGFLVYNMPPARVFMGDVGSLAMGFMLAVVSAMVLREALTGPSPSPALILALPAAWAMQLGDLGMVLVTRLRRGASPIRGGVDHTSHRLMRGGLSPAAMLGIVLGMAAASAATGLVAVASGSAIIATMLVGMVGVVVVAFHSILASRVPHA